MKTNNTKSKPAYEVRLNHIRATVWENAGSEGKGAWFNTSVSRRYQDGDEWKDATTFNGLADLALVAEAVRMCQEFIRRQDAGRNERDDNSF